MVNYRIKTNDHPRSSTESATNSQTANSTSANSDLSSSLSSSSLSSYKSFLKRQQQQQYQHQANPNQESIELQTKESENRSYTSSLILPQQFIDISLFFYSPSASSVSKSALTESISSSSTSSPLSKLQSSITSNESNSFQDHSSSNNTNSILTSSLTSSLYSSSSSASSSSTDNNLDNSMMMMVTANSSSLNNNNNPSLLNPQSMLANNNNSNNSSDEHEELLAEMELIERLPTQERLKQAKRRRALQLKKWSDYERELNILNQNPLTASKSPYNMHISKKSTKKTVSIQPSRSIKFQDHIVLLDAIMRKDYDEVERLLETGVTPNSSNEDGLTAIHQCCIDDSADLLRLLIKYGADVNVCDNDLWTPLHAAATCANLEICKILIENNADLLAVNTDGNMPYDICDDEVCLEYIESEMAARGVTQQTIDIKRSETEIRMLQDLKQLCFMQPNTNTNSNQFMKQFNLDNLDNNFHSYFKNTITSDGLLNLNAKDANGATLLHIACANGYNSIIEFLLNDCLLAYENGAPLIPSSLYVKDNDGWTPLHVATFWGHQKSIELLLENGADINARTNNDETVLELCDDPDVRDFIVQKSKEIETEQQKLAAARAAAAIQQQQQLKQQQLQQLNGANNSNNSNNSSNNGSIKLNNLNSNNNNNNINNSTRSLKRTSTGVSRSSSVRRSSFREKEKAARKLDTSFKDVLYANEQHDTYGTIVDNIDHNDSSVNNSNNLNNSDMSPKYSNNLVKNGDEKDGYFVKINNNNTTNDTKSLPLVINHTKENITYPSIDNPTNNQKLTTVVKIVNSLNGESTSSASSSSVPTTSSSISSSGLPPQAPPSTSSSSSSSQIATQIKSTSNSALLVLPPISAANSKKNFVDDYNNNQLRIAQNNTSTSTANNTTINPNLTNNNNSTLTTVSQVARIHSNGSVLTYQNNTATTNLSAVNNNNNLNTNMSGSNFSMSSSLVSTSSTIPVNQQNGHLSSSFYNTSNLSQPNGNNLVASVTNGTVINTSENNQNQNSTVSTSSIAVIDVNNVSNLSNNTKRIIEMEPHFNNGTTSAYTKQPMTANKYNNGGLDDGVKYKFISNETIGAKSSINNEFADVQVDTGSSKFSKCVKCLKCCSVM